MMRNRLKYALTYKDVEAILMQRLVSIDGKVRTDSCYPAGFMDVVTIGKTNENFRLLYDSKGRFKLHHISAEEAKYSFRNAVQAVQNEELELRVKGAPYITTVDGRIIRYPDPLIKSNDLVKITLEIGKVVDYIKFNTSNIARVIDGRNRRRVRIVQHCEKHQGSFDIIHVQDLAGHKFATRLGNEFIIEQGTKPWIILHPSRGIKLSIIEEARKRRASVKALTRTALVWRPALEMKNTLFF